MGDMLSSLVFRPPPPTPLAPSKYFWLDTKCEGSPDGTGKIPAFFLKRRGATVTVLFSHGNAEDLGMMYTRMKDIAMLFKVSVLAYDYSGYGKSTGQVSEQNCYWNIEAAYKFLVEVRNIPPESIILYGRSVGSGPTCYLAAKTASEGRSVGGVILHSPFLSVCRVAVDAGFSLPGDLFRNLDQAPKIRCPVFIIHGTSDTVVPFWHGQELLMHVPAEYRAPPFWAEGMGHNGIELFMRQTYLERVSTFLLKYIASSVGVPIPPQPIPEIDRVDVEVGERSPCTVRLNFKWLGAGPLVRKRGKNETSALPRKDADVAQQNNGEDDENAGPLNDEDNRTLFTEMNETVVQGVGKVNENTLNNA